jgi:hypothetical protein
MPADDTTLEDLNSLFSADQIQQTIQVAAHHQLAQGATANQVREHAKELISLGPTIKADFEALIASENYVCRSRIASDKHTRMCTLLFDPSSAANRSDRNLYQWAKTHFELREQGRVLYRNPEKGYNDYRRVLWPTEVFDTIARAHLRALHIGRDKTWIEIDQQFYGIKKEEVMWVIDHCAFCLANRAVSTKAPLEAIIVDEIFKRVQIDLVDMRHEPSGKYKWVLHIKDHFSKFSFLYPLVSKHRLVLYTSFI